MPEPLDFCRIKKIDEKGFGFLKSLHYPGDVFFHFSQIKKEEMLDRLNQMKRGDFIVYFTSRVTDKLKRKVDRFWYKLQDVPVEFIDEFKSVIIKEFDGTRINTFDLLHVFSELKEMSLISREELTTILTSKKIHSLPTTILPLLNPEEKVLFREILQIDELAKKENKPFWYEDFVN